MTPWMPAGMVAAVMDVEPPPSDSSDPPARRRSSGSTGAATDVSLPAGVQRTSSVPPTLQHEQPPPPPPRSMSMSSSSGAPGATAAAAAAASAALVGVPAQLQQQSSQPLPPLPQPASAPPQQPALPQPPATAAAAAQVVQSGSPLAAAPAGSSASSSSQDQQQMQVPVQQAPVQQVQVPTQPVPTQEEQPQSDDELASALFLNGCEAGKEPLWRFIDAAGNIQVRGSTFGTRSWPLNPLPADLARSRCRHAMLHLVVSPCHHSCARHRRAPIGVPIGAPHAAFCPTHLASCTCANVKPTPCSFHLPISVHARDEQGHFSARVMSEGFATGRLMRDTLVCGADRTLDAVSACAASALLCALAGHACPWKQQPEALLSHSRSLLCPTLCAVWSASSPTCRP